MTNIWTPGGSVSVRGNRRPPIDVADLSDEVAGPDARFQSHGPGCRCGDLDCHWYRGEVARERWANADPRQRREWAQQVHDALTDDATWAIRAALDRMVERARHRRRHWRFWKGE